MKELVKDFLKEYFYFLPWSDFCFEQFYSENCIWIEDEFILNDYCKMVLIAKYSLFIRGYFSEDGVPF